MLAALAGGVLPAVVHAILRRALQQALASGSEAVEKALDRTAMAVALPWRTHAPARFDPVHLRQALDRSHGGLDRVKSRLVEVLAASRRTGGLLTVEAPPRSGGGEEGRTQGRRCSYAHGRSGRPYASRAWPDPGGRARRRWPWPPPGRSAAPCT